MKTIETTASPVRLDTLQLACLQEMGVETALLRPFLRHVAAPAISVALPPRSLAAVQDLAKSLRGNGQVAAHQPASGNQDGNPASQTEIPRKKPQIRPQVLLQQRSEAAPRPALPARTPNLACQHCVAQDKAVLPGTGSMHSPSWLIVAETATAGDAHALVQGQAGQLLRTMLAAAGMQAVDAIVRLHISQVLSASAPAEQPPTLQDQIRQQAALQRPTCILALGRAAVGAVLGVTDSLESLRGKVWSCIDAAGCTVPVVATYPPGWLLTNPQHKKDVWHDLLLARAVQCASAPQ